jgi:hypothetical protein
MKSEAIRNLSQRPRVRDRRGRIPAWRAGRMNWNLPAAMQRADGMQRALGPYEGTRPEPRRESPMKRMLLAIAVLGASAMDGEIDVPLDRSQWETLKALGAPDPSRWRADDLAIQTLVAAKLAEIREGRAVLTAEGRKAVVRGSPRLWDASG